MCEVLNMKRNEVQSCFPDIHTLYTVALSSIGVLLYR